MRSIEAAVTDLVLRCLPHDAERDYAAERKKNDGQRPLKLPKGVVAEEIKINSLPGEKLSREGNDKGIIFYIHGGGFTTGSAKERRIITQYIPAHLGYDVISINYRLSPEHKWPAHLEDCLEAYDNVIREHDPKDIVLMGESAGGTLVLSLGLAIREKALPMPRAIVSLSPATEQSRHLPSHRDNIKTDYMLRDMVYRGLTEVMFDHERSQEELKDPLLSPYYGDYEGLPPIFLSVSDSETLYDDTMILYEKLRNEGHPVKLEVGHRLCHAYQIMSYMPEAKKTLRIIFDFLDSLGEDKTEEQGEHHGSERKIR